MKITDFGVSSGISTQTSRGTMAGTQGFVAPEIVFGEKYSVQADIWSLGKTCIQLATGDPSNNLDFGKWSDEFFSFVNCCLKKDASKRSTVKQLLKVVLCLDE